MKGERSTNQRVIPGRDAVQGGPYIPWLHSPGCGEMERGVSHFGARLSRARSWRLSPNRIKTRLTRGQRRDERSARVTPRGETSRREGNCFHSRVRDEREGHWSRDELCILGAQVGDGGERQPPVCERSVLARSSGVTRSREREHRAGTDPQKWVERKYLRASGDLQSLLTRQSRVL